MRSEQAFDRLIFLLVDGVPYDIFNGLVQDGDLPNIQRHVVERGGLKRAVSVFPSTTGPAFIPFLMGLYPGTANVPGIRWLSKADYGQPHRYHSPGICSYMGVDGLAFSKDLPTKSTLFNHFSSVSNIYNLLTQGCPSSRNLTRRVKLPMYAYAHFGHRWKHVDAVASKMLLKAVDEGDEFVMCLFPGVDGYSHLSHTRSDAVLASYRAIDTTVGDLCHSLQQSGTYERTLIVITSDHGMSNTHTHIDIPRSLDGHGWRCLHYPLLWKRNVKCASFISGNGMGHIYFKNTRNAWGGRLPAEQLIEMGAAEALLELEGIDFVAAQSGHGSIVVCKPDGTGEISYSDSKISYRYIGTDPLGYGKSYKRLSFREALVETYASDYPDGLVQLWQLFQSPRTGDLVVSAQPGYDLRARYEYPQHYSTHGALAAPQMYVPLATNMPLTTEYVRTVDVFPTILAQFGQTLADSEIDGQVLT